MSAIDVSDGALEVARANAAATGVDVRFELRDLREGLAGSYDLVVSNPPYVTAAEIEGLQPEVRDWEPRVATVGEEHTGRSPRAARRCSARRLARARGRRRQGGRRFRRLLRGLGYAGVQAGRDLAGRDRVVEGRWSSRR